MYYNIPCSHLHHQTRGIFLSGEGRHVWANMLTAMQRVSVQDRYISTHAHACTRAHHLYAHCTHTERAWEDKAPARGNKGYKSTSSLTETYFHGTVQRTNTVPATTFPCSPPGRVRLAKSGRFVHVFFFFEKDKNCKSCV